jgi:hypothetical protein
MQYNKPKWWYYSMSRKNKPQRHTFNRAYAWQNVLPETIISSWKKLWPHIHYLLEQWTHGARRIGKGWYSTSVLQEAIAELCEQDSYGTIIADICNCLAVSEEENLQIMTDEEIINNALETTTARMNKRQVCTDYPFNTTWWPHECLQHML